MYELKENLDLQVGALKASLGDCQELPESLSTFAKLGRAKKSQQWRQRLTRVKAIQFTNHKKQSQLEKKNMADNQRKLSKRSWVRVLEESIYLMQT